MDTYRLNPLSFDIFHRNYQVQVFCICSPWYEVHVDQSYQLDHRGKKVFDLSGVPKKALLKINKTQICPKITFFHIQYPDSKCSSDKESAFKKRFRCVKRKILPNG